LCLCAYQLHIIRNEFGNRKLRTQHIQQQYGALAIANQYQIYCGAKGGVGQ
jgi:hypothetical protein